MIFEENYFSYFSIDWPDPLVWLPLILEVMGDIYIVIICFLVYDVINFEINFSFLIKPFYYRTKKSGQKCEYLKN